MRSNKDFYSEEQIKAARFAKALGHPARIYVLQFLAKEKNCYSGNMLELLPIAASTLSQHLTELKNAGLIKGCIEPPKIKYCIDKDNWAIAKKYFKDILDIVK